MLSNTSIREYFELGFALSDEVLQEMVQETDHLICPLLGISLGVHIHKVIVQRYEYSKTAAIQKILQSTRQEYEKRTMSRTKALFRYSYASLRYLKAIG